MKYLFKIDYMENYERLKQLAAYVKDDFETLTAFESLTIAA